MPTNMGKEGLGINIKVKRDKTLANMNSREKKKVPRKKKQHPGGRKRALLVRYHYLIERSGE